MVRRLTSATPVNNLPIEWLRPVAFKKGTSDVDEKLTMDIYPTWKKLEEMVDKGKVRNIGVSKYVTIPVIR